MPSSTDVRATADPRPGPAARWRDAVLDLGHLLRFRSATVRRRWPVRVGLLIVVALTAFFALFPASIEPDVEFAGAALDDLRRVLPYALPGFFLLALGSSMGGGGGRELLGRDQSVIHPIGPVTEHLGSLVLAPLNLAWWVQVWCLLAATGLLVDDHLIGSLIVIAVWAVAATSLAQAAGWVVEGVRRLPYGVWAVRGGGLGLGLVIGALHLLGVLDDVVDALPSQAVVATLGTGRWPLTALALVVVAALGVLAGGASATWALAKPPREELKVETGVHEARPEPRSLLGSDFAMMRRMDRDSVWRSIGMRRGLMVLGTGPGLVALIGGMTWSQALMLPGLAASGAALLFAVNAWCLDGRGAVWRATLPVSAATVFAARAVVALECFAVVSLLTLALVVVRRGLPEPGFALALVAAVVVVWLQVLSVSMWWSVRRPFAVNLSSPRATPAPPTTMLGYAAKLSLVVTLTGIVFAALGEVGVWWLTLGFAAPLLLWSSVRLWWARRRWLDDQTRASIALAVVP